MPVVLAAGSSGILLHEAIGHGMEADFNRKNVSIYSDKIGKPIAKPFVNIVDDGTQRQRARRHQRRRRGQRRRPDHAGARTASSPPTSTTRSRAKHYGVKPTGNGRRESYQYAPMPRMRSTYMLPGPHKKEEIIASVKKGIYCSNFSNGQVKIGAGDFTFYVKNGYLIEDGKLTRPIKDVNIIGNGPKVLEKIDMVSDDLAIDEGGWTCGKDGQSVPVSQGMPTVRVSSITVGGRERAGLSHEHAARRPRALSTSPSAAPRSPARRAPARRRRAPTGARRRACSGATASSRRSARPPPAGSGSQLYVDGRYAVGLDQRPAPRRARARSSATRWRMTRTLAPDPYRSPARSRRSTRARPTVDLKLEDPGLRRPSTPEQRRRDRRRSSRRRPAR